MSIRASFIAAIFISLGAFAMPAAAETAPARHANLCSLAAFKATQVASLYKSVPTGRGVVQRLSGAQLFLPAQPGLTPQWIHASLTRRMQADEVLQSRECPLDVEDARVTVASAATGFWVQISASDGKAATEILNRARRFVR